MAENQRSELIDHTHEKNSLSTHKGTSWLYYAAIVVFLMFLSGSGSPVELRCIRVEPRGSGNCVKQTYLLGIMPLSEQKIDDVRGALVSETEDYEGDTGYRIELRTADGMVPLRNLYISDFTGKAVKDELANQVNEFVRSQEPGTLAVTEPGLLSLDNVSCILISLLLTTVGSYVWKEVKSVFGGARDA